MPREQGSEGTEATKGRVSSKRFAVSPTGVSLKVVIVARYCVSPETFPCLSAEKHTAFDVKEMCLGLCSPEGRAQAGAWVQVDYLEGTQEA